MKFEFSIRVKKINLKFKLLNLMIIIPVGAKIFFRVDGQKGRRADRQADRQTR
jgi:hypothetical protein